ncbi:helix-turn-helix domain-containing protein [Prescottella equi]|uniref:helix-turn-helix domain-containing protein n=1 Tax=Rhodococcus hoagii TaxID=43767 RepID=UPI000A0FAAFF|nr:helix-turn-helix transcriptional regulator [Prescottella equi]NKS16847.1 helix-turn-helix domain-containing protein [Prescottella equi]NKS22348.1 helix-turn-helix domain-containing protein [Prescottella equi]ORJ93229.1 transcriptional regulator [Prescottella equi]
MSRTQQPVGDQIRWWRGHRRMTQLDLANRADVSTRHVSFLETGRARPTRAMLLRLGDHLDIPLRDRNAMLLAAGFAPAFPEHTLTDVPMAVVSDAIRTILTAHAPMPALVVDRHWNLVDANDTVALLTDGAAPRLLEPPVNVLRLSLHPDGMASRITNLAQWRAHVLHRLDRQIDATGDDELRRLRIELASYASGADATEPGPSLVVPLRIRVGDDDLSFLSTTTVFGTPLDVAVSELAIETFFPADAATSEFLAARR